MEETLRDLEQVMAAHRAALAETRAPRPAIRPEPPRSGDPRILLLARLALDVERVSGIEMTGMMTAKLNRALNSVELPALEAWISQLHLLPPDDPEWLSLVETLTVHETFFHRDSAQLELLARVMPELIAGCVSRHRYCLRLWSAGCATGEEAYTLAILALAALRDAGFADETADGIVCRAPWQLDVLGTDISRLVLTQAATAVYSTEGLSPFRELPPYLQRFFPILPKTSDSGEVELRGVLPSIRRHVRFAHFNLMHKNPPETGFDAVLCRNVLIYLTTAARAKAQQALKSGLRPGGFLFLGPTDSIAEADAFAPRWSDGAIAYCRKPGHA